MVSIDGGGGQHLVSLLQEEPFKALVPVLVSQDVKTRDHDLSNQVL